MTQHGKELNFLETEIKELIGKVQTDLTSKFETDIEQIKKNFEKDIKEQNKITIEILEVLAKKVTSGRAKTNTKSIIHFYKVKFFFSAFFFHHFFFLLLIRNHVT